MEVEEKEKEVVKEAVKGMVAGKEVVAGKEGVKLLNGAKPKDSGDSELPHDGHGDAVENGEMSEINGSDVVTDDKCNGVVASEDAGEKGCNGVEKEGDTKDATSDKDVNGEAFEEQTETASMDTQEGKEEVTEDGPEKALEDINSALKSVEEEKITEDAPEKILEETNDNTSDTKVVENEEQPEDSLKILEEVNVSVNEQGIKPTEANIKILEEVKVSVNEEDIKQTEANIKPAEEGDEPVDGVESVEESSPSQALLGEASEEPENTEETAPVEAVTASPDSETDVLEAETAPKEAETNHLSEPDEKEASEKESVTDAEDDCKTTDSSTENTKKFIAGLQNLLESSAEDSDTKMEENVENIETAEVVKEKRVVSPFVDESIKEGEEPMEEEGEDRDVTAEVEPNKPEEKTEEVSASGSIELEKADPAEASEEEELDIDRSLEACLDDLEKNIDEESEEAPVATRETSEVVKEKVVESMENSVDNSATGNSSDADDEGGDSRMSTGNTSETEEPNAEEALASLSQIEKNTKRILDDDWTDEAESGKKRGTDESRTAEPAVKKPKLDGDGAEESAAMRKKIKKSLRKMKRSDIEEMIASKCIELITNKSEVGKLRQQVTFFGA